MLKPLLKVFIICLILSQPACRNLDLKEECNTQVAIKKEPFCEEGITELKRGDIIVRPNLNLLPGSSQVAGGQNFGHAAIVVKGYVDGHIDNLLKNTIIVESIAKDVPQAFQVREIPALAHHPFDAFNNVNFDNSKTGHRYRLRLKLSEAEIDSVVNFALAQKGDFSSWNAAKRIPSKYKKDQTSPGWANNSTWYCSLLVWQSVIATTGLDTDVNGGYMVYPNDLINSPLFDNTQTHKGRVRF